MLNHMRTQALPNSPFSPHTPRSPMYSRDEELGKRDDDFRPALKPARTSSLRVANAAQPWKWRRRRVLGVVLLLVAVYVFVKNMPTDLKPIDERLGIRRYTPGVRVIGPGGQGHGHGQEAPVKQNYAGVHGEPVGAPPRSVEMSEAQETAFMHYYEGPIRFYRLAKSLHAIAKLMGTKQQNRNVLFAASSLRSVANLMPMACEMGRWDRNHVHLVITGRSPLPLDDILEVNGVDKASCNVYFHDARGDYSEYSTDQRARASVAGAMKHVQDLMHPQAVIMDDAELEDEFFVKAMKAKMREYRKTLIEIPAARYEDFLWMTRLDSGSLASWYRPRIEILVHAPQQSSGGLLRLMKSLQGADYAGLRIPSLTIELPSDLEFFAKRYLSRLVWPPGRRESDPSSLTLRHRIPASHLSTEQASLRFVESFYPTSTDDSHVLILSPQVELSPVYLHYLLHVILEYRYSAYAPPNAEDLLGAALDVPLHFANGTGDFQVPLVKDMHAHRYTKNEDLDQLVLSPFTYEAPSTAAGLVFGDKWSTLHSFLTNRIAASHAGKSKKTQKLMSETEPSWAEYLLELMRCRSWVMLYPSQAFVTVHNDLAQIPEEFLREGKTQGDAEDSTPDQPLSEEEPFLTAPSPPTLAPRIQPEKENTHDLRPLHEMLPFKGDLPEIPHMPFITHTGEYLHIDDRHGLRDSHIAHFRRTIGGCKAEEARRKRWAREGSTDDLFCLPGLKVEYVEEEEEEGSEDDVSGFLDDHEAQRIAEAIVLGTTDPAGDGPSLEKVVPPAATEESQGAPIA